jgi:hypothetical protein
MNESIIGTTGPDYEFIVERGKIAEFARAIHSDNPDFRGDEAIAPPTFLTVAGGWWGYSLEEPKGTVFGDLGIDTSLLLHAEEEFEYFAPPPKAGDRFTARLQLTDAFEKFGKRGGKLTFYTFETEFRNPAGELLAVQRTTCVQTEKAPEKEV